MSHDGEIRTPQGHKRVGRALPSCPCAKPIVRLGHPPCGSRDVILHRVPIPLVLVMKGLKFSTRVLSQALCDGARIHLGAQSFLAQEKRKKGHSSLATILLLSKIVKVNAFGSKKVL